MNELFTYATILDLFVAAYVQFIIMLTELQEVLSQELKCLCSEATTVPSEWTKPTTKDVHVSLLHFYCIINKYIV